MLGILGHCPWQEPHKTVPWQRWLNTRGGEEGLCLPCWADPLLWKTSVSHSKSLNQALVNLSSHPPRTGQLFTVQLQYAFAQQFFFFFFWHLHLSSSVISKNFKNHRPQIIDHIGQFVPKSMYLHPSPTEVKHNLSSLQQQQTPRLPTE